jgi:hypothetical protein
MVKQNNIGEVDGANVPGLVFNGAAIPTPLYCISTQNLNVGCTRESLFHNALVFIIFFFITDLVNVEFTQIIRPVTRKLYNIVDSFSSRG